jgi:hypothetical protein
LQNKEKKHLTLLPRKNQQKVKIGLKKQIQGIGTRTQILISYMSVVHYQIHKDSLQSQNKRDLEAKLSEQRDCQKEKSRFGGKIRFIENLGLK